MPIQDSYLEYLAKKINSRNFSDILPVMAFLKRRENEEYVPTSFSRILYRYEAIGENQASNFSIFDGTKDPANTNNAKTQFARGDEIAVTGRATYRYMNGSTVLQIKPAIQITAQIDSRATPTGNGKQIFATAGEIVSEAFANDVGRFSFKIPSNITSQLAPGTYYVWIDASSPENRPVRLGVTGSENDTVSITIT